MQRGSGARSRLPEPAGDLDERHHDRHDSDVENEQRGVVAERAGDLSGVERGPQHAVVAEEIRWGSTTDQQTRDDNERDSVRGRKRPEASERRRRSRGSTRRAAATVPASTSASRTELRANARRHSHCRERRKLPTHGRALDDANDRQKGGSEREVRNALREETGGVDGRRNGDRQRARDERPTDARGATGEEGGGHRYERDYKCVQELREVESGLAVAAESDERRDEHRVDGTVAVLSPRTEGRSPSAPAEAASM